MARIKIIILLVLICRYVYSGDDFMGRGLALGLHRPCVISSPEALVSNPAGLYGIPTPEHILTYDFKENKKILLTNQPLLLIEGANIGFGFVKKSGLKKYILGFSLFKIERFKKFRPIFIGANIKLKEGEERGLGLDLGCLYVSNKIDAGIVLHNLGFDDDSKNNVIVGINYKLNKFSTMISYDKGLSLGTELYILKQPIIRIGLHNMGITLGVAVRHNLFIIDYGYYSKDNLNIISIRLK